MELAIIEVHEQLVPLTSEYVDPGQERVFLSGVYNVICSYVQEVHSMVLGQAVVPTQIIPGIWGVRWGILAEALLLAPQIGPVEVSVHCPRKSRAPEPLKRPKWVPNLNPLHLWHLPRLQRQRFLHNGFPHSS